jgi:PAS domain S-box-containing protein
VPTYLFSGQLPDGIAEHDVFRSLFAAYPDGLVVADAGGKIVIANPAAANLLGYALQELVGLPVDALVPDAIRPRHASFREGYARQPKARPMGTQMELVARRKDGSETMVEIALSPLQIDGVPLVVAAIRGIEAYPRVKQALLRARYSEHLALIGRMAVDVRDPQRLLSELPTVAAAALEADIAFVALMEPDGRHVRIAGGHGLLAEEAVGTLLPTEGSGSIAWFLAHEGPCFTDYQTETRFEVPDAFREAGLRVGMGVPIIDRGKVIGFIAVRSRRALGLGDEEQRFLTALGNLLATSLQRAESEEALGHAQRLESVGQLTGGIAHDFNNLLTVIQGNLQVLEELPGVAQDAYALQLVAAAARASRRGADLTGKLLAFSRRQVLQPSVVDLDGLLGALADMLRRTLDQRIVIYVEVAAHCPEVLVDPSQLESALLNIAINARDAMTDGGALTFRAWPCTELPSAARVDLDEAGDPGLGYVGISIADNGSGMSESVKERAFEPFFTTKEHGRGTGLGLSTVYGFVKQSHGAVMLDSVAGAGTTITLFLPVHREAASADVGETDAPARELPTGLRVLLVEDDPEVRHVVARFLDALGCHTEEAANAEEALGVLDRTLEPFDVLLSDIALGTGMRGTELASHAQARDPALAVLLMSGFSAELLEVDRSAPPSWELLRKPYTRQELAAALARITTGP